MPCLTATNEVTIAPLGAPAGCNLAGCGEGHRCSHEAYRTALRLFACGFQVRTPILRLTSNMPSRLITFVSFSSQHRSRLPESVEGRSGSLALEGLELVVTTRGEFRGSNTYTIQHILYTIDYIATSTMEDSMRTPFRSNYLIADPKCPFQQSVNTVYHNLNSSTTLLTQLVFISNL